MPQINLYENELNTMQFQAAADKVELDARQEQAVLDLKTLRNFRKSRPRSNEIHLPGKWFRLTRFLPLRAWLNLVKAHLSLMWKIADFRRLGRK